MIFSRPLALILCLVPIIVMIFLLRKKNKKVVFADLPLDVWNGVENKPNETLWKTLRFLIYIFLSFSWIVLCVVVANPIKKTDDSFSVNRESQVIFALDCSPSMASQDLEPNRLVSAKEVVKAFIKNSKGLQIGLVAFGAQSALVCPPITNMNIVTEQLEKIVPGILGEGTAVGQGLGTALESAISSNAKNKIVVLMTDGEDNVGFVNPQEAALEFKNKGINLIIAGIGSRGDVPVNYTDPFTGKIMKGVYHSLYDRNALASIANNAQGLFIKIDKNEDINLLVNELNSFLKSHEVKEINVSFNIQKIKNEQSPYKEILLVIAFVFAGLAWIVKYLIMGGLA